MFIKIKPNIYINSDHVISVNFYDGPNDIPQCFFNWRDPSLPATIAGPCALLFTVNRAYSYLVSAHVARGLLDFAEANDSLDLDETPPEVPSLKSKIANALRTVWKGALMEQLDAIFPDAGMPAIREAVQDLMAERVLIMIPDALRPGARGPYLLYHASGPEAQEYQRKRNSIHFRQSAHSMVCRFTDWTLAASSVIGTTCAECLALLKPSPDPLVAGEALPDASDLAEERSGSTVDPKIES